MSDFVEEILTFNCEISINESIISNKEFLN